MAIAARHNIQIMITVAGEALIDFVVGASGSVVALPGGAPFNVARTTARLGGDCQFVGKLSDDKIRRATAGRRSCRPAYGLRSPDTTPRPRRSRSLGSTISALLNTVLPRRQTSSAELSPADVPSEILDGSNALALGGLGLLGRADRVEPVALIKQKPPGATILLDPNCRLEAVTDLASYREMIDTVLRQVDIVKVSTDDLRLLRPGVIAVQGRA